MASAFKQTSSSREEVLSLLSQRLAALEENQNLLVRVCIQLLQKLEGDNFEEQLLLCHLRLVQQVHYLEIPCCEEYFPSFYCKIQEVRHHLLRYIEESHQVIHCGACQELACRE